MKTSQIVLAFLVILSLSDITFAYGAAQGNWRWRNDDGDVYTANWKDSLNTPVVLTEYENIRLRIESIYGSPYNVYENISLSYTEDLDNFLWTPINNLDTGKFFISASQYLLDTMSYFDNQLLSQNTPQYLYRRTITFDEVDNYYLFGEENSKYELEYSIKPTSNIQPGSAYFFSLCRDSISMNLYLDGPKEYATLLTPPINWIPQSSGTSKYLSGVFFTDTNNGIVVGGEWGVGDVILKTTNGGENWNLQSSGIAAYLYDVCFTDADTGWVIGYRSKILKTIDGGESWTPQLSGTTIDLRSLNFISSTTGWVVGEEGIILHTTNGGNNWSQQSSGIASILSDVYFIDADKGWAVSENGTILKTTDGGANWTPQSSGTTVILNSVYFTDANNGTAVGLDYSDTSGTIIRTTNGGDTWAQVTGVPDNSGLGSVYFSNTNIGWVVGAYGLILKTTDGGLNWIKLVSGSSKQLQSVRFIDNEIGWAVGAYGKILKTTNGGVTFVEEEKTHEIPTSYFLSNNYPNPFNPSTKIKYTIPTTNNPLLGGVRGGLITMKVYDVLGREVTTLVNESKQPGEYEVEFNASSLSSGIYFYQLSAGDFIQTKKMLLLK